MIFVLDLGIICSLQSAVGDNTHHLSHCIIFYEFEVKGNRGGVSDSGGKGIQSVLSRTNFSNIHGITIKRLLATICLFSLATSSNFKLTV